jgi:uncharacterized membrane protein HdeD (DUF308 family)
MIRSPKKTALWFLIASVAISAVLGIWAILSGDFGELQGRVLLTTLTITGASICGLACGAYWETGRYRHLPEMGIFFTLAGAGVVIFGIWSKTSDIGFWKIAAINCLVAIATAHVSLLSLARLSSRYRFALVVAYVLAYLLAALLIVAMFAESNKSNWFPRLIGVVSILLAAVSLVVPIFHRLSAADIRAQESVAVSESGLWATFTCPRCGTALPSSADEIVCGHCRCRFRVSILGEPREVIAPA